MIINNFWYICISVRILLIFLVSWLYTNNKKIISLILFSMGIGFLYKYITGSNNEIQLSKVFWHETRLIHASFYILASYYLIKDNLHLGLLLLSSDLIFSILYRFLLNK